MENSLNQIRLTLGYKQQEIADKLGINVNTYRGYEYKKRDLPDDFLASLIIILNVNVNWLLTGQGDMFISTCENTLAKCNNDDIIKNLDTFFKRLNQIQKENELNDFLMSKETGISESRLEKLGIGKAKPTLEELNSLKSRFDVSIDWLLYGATPCRNVQNEDNALSADEIKVLKKLAMKNNLS